MKTSVISKIFTLLLCSLIIFANTRPIFSQDSAVFGQTEADRLRQIREQISQTEQLLEQTRKKRATLQNEIIFQDSQIKLTALKIAETEEEIESLTGQINQLEGVLGELSRVFTERAVETYKLKRLGDPFVFLLTSGDISEVILRFHYLQRIQQADRELLLKMQSAQTNYEDQRTEVEKLKEKLEGQKAQLARQRVQKQQLLTVTQSDEKRYQQLLATLRADAASIERALASVGARLGDVGKGEIIAAVGNTGCSTGPHLHFETFENAKVEGGRVIGNRVNPQTYLDNGRFTHPLPGSEVTVPYGASYLLGVHTGIDFAYKYADRPSAGAPIYAAEKGVAYIAQDSQTCYLTGTAGKGIIVDHQNGLVTLYWHIP